MTEDDLSAIHVVPATDFAFRVNGGDLSAMLSRAATVVPTGNVYEVLKNVRVDVGDALCISGTDNDLAAVLTTSNFSAVRRGSGVLPAKQLLEVVRSHEDKVEYEFDVRGGFAHVSASKTKWQLRVPDGSLFPQLPNLDAVTFHEVARAPFAEAVALVRTTVSSDSIRPQLQMVDVTAGKVRSSDGVRYQQVLLDAWPDGLSVQIPFGAVDVLLGLLRASERETVEVAETEDFFAYRIDGEVFITTRLVDPFPDLVEERLLTPALQNDQRLAVARTAFLDAIRRARITADPETSAVVLSLEPGLIIVRCRDKHQNTTAEVVEATWSGKDRDVAFRHQHLTDLLRSVKTPVCEFYLGSDRKNVRMPLLYRDDEAGFLAAVSQLRVDA